MELYLFFNIHSIYNDKPRFTGSLLLEFTL